MFFDPREVGMKPPPFKHTVYNALVVPRPIGWISTLDADGDETLRTRVVDLARQIDWPEGYSGRVLVNDFITKWRKVQVH